MMMADIYGDWREELITVVPGKLLIYTTTIPAIDKRNCLMQDPLYRSDVVHRSMGYFQSPVTSYYLGENSKEK
jgi:rhamnogalacturonan endolyase